MKEALYTIFCVCTAMVGYHIHHDFIWAVVDFFFAPIAWTYWLVLHQVNLSIIKATFSWFFQ
jgi:hypothetical protein